MFVVLLLCFSYPALVGALMWSCMDTLTEDGVTLCLAPRRATWPLLNVLLEGKGSRLDVV